jgi:hypothetical protein
MDLARPDYFAAGVPLVSVSRTVGSFTPKIIGLWRDGESYAGAQVDLYARGIEAYANGFWSEDRERMFGMGLRGTVKGWTLHGESGPVWRAMRTAPRLANSPTGETPSPFFRPRAVRWRAAFGANHSILSRGLVTVEYLYDATGWSPVQFSAVAQPALSMRVEPGSAFLDENTAEAYRAGMLRRHHVYLGYHHSWRQKWRLAVRHLVCAEDSSGYVQPSISWAPADHAELGAELFINYGTGATEFGLFPVRTNVLFRIKYFF